MKKALLLAALVWAGISCQGIAQVGPYTPQGAIVATPPPPAVSGGTIGASPFTYTNNDQITEQVFMTGGTITGVVLTRGSVSTVNIGALGGITVAVLLAPGDQVTVTYSAAPTAFLKFPVSNAR